MTFDVATGQLLGVSQAGGSYDRGSIYELNPPTGNGSTWKRTIIHSFNSEAADGFGPAAAPLQVGNTFFGGNIGGAVYEFTP